MTPSTFRFMIILSLGIIMVCMAGIGFILDDIRDKTPPSYIHCENEKQWHPDNGNLPDSRCWSGPWGEHR